MKFSKLDGITYASDFYDGETAKAISDTPVHPFVKQYSPSGTLFEYEKLILAFLVVLAREFLAQFHVGFLSTKPISVAQAYFWVNVISFYYKLRLEEKEFSEEEEKTESLKVA